MGAGMDDGKGAGAGNVAATGMDAAAGAAAYAVAFTVADAVEALAGAGLLDHVEGPEGTDALKVPVTGCSFDSREVGPGALFFAKGTHFEPSFLDGALAAGASCFVADASLAGALGARPGAGRVPGIYVTDVRRAMSVLPPLVYGHPDRELEVVGITGTKGKSTTAYMLRAILMAAGREPGILGSIMTDDGVERFESHNTTPEAPELWRHLAHCRESGRHEMVMEVSSQGLKYGRVAGLPLDIACFLNIGRDHISAIEHPTFEDYFESKLLIFKQCATAVVNLGTDHVERVLEAAREGADRVVTVAVEGVAGAESAAVRAVDVRAEEGRIDFTLELATALSPTGEPCRRAIELGIPGGFNVENALVAIACARLLGVGLDDIAAGLAHVRVPGRMEVVRSDDGRVVALVDYAHNKLSYQRLFESVRREYAGRRVIAVFGAPGGKAKERRRDLPQTAAPYTDLMIFTEEDPAYERVEDICAELAANVPEGSAYEIICDRERAVKRAFDVAAEGGPAIVLLLAKGDETRQHRGDDYPTVKSDLAMARELIRTV